MNKEQYVIQLIELVYRHSNVRTTDGKLYADNLDVKSFIIDLVYRDRIIIEDRGR